MYRGSDQTRDVKSTARMFVQLIQKFLKDSLVSFHDRRAVRDVTTLAVQHANLHFNSLLLMHVFPPFLQFQQQTESNLRAPVSSFCNNTTRDKIIYLRVELSHSTFCSFPSPVQKVL